MSQDIHDNGTGDPGVARSARQRIAAELEKEIGGLLQREHALELQLAEVKNDLKTFEQSLRRLRGEPLIKHPGRSRTTPANPGSKTRVSEERVEMIRQAIFRYAEDHEEFRQVDIRSMMEGTLANSSVMAMAFERLRQDNVIRFARQDGNAKMFRLTRQTVSS